MMEAIAIYTGCGLLLVGSLFSLVAAIGVVRLPDLLTRMHAASKAGPVGAGFVLIAVALLSGDAGVALRAIVGVVFLLLTTPVGAHLLARASYRTSDQLGGNMVLDELKSKTGQSPGA
ncbi:monovalent cation/H(+) antiporter subunit G [Devosia oryziradicis]|uniref:Monovalent cation/H(+) antiporter subunit G n=1 Tax=Devosia oryziradicis TaxID=2801335 RepID=A0ABX7BZ33_9HYPH|nr:monovalent cation/H(+) antiporter subunit G [Devosia oryziradicis]QQR35680.1 monovalent cation/H(+) antiporter subunit G [Devosia oryziradicis]